MKFLKIITLIILILATGCKEKISEEKEKKEKSELKRKFELSEESIRLSEIKIERVEKRKFSDFTKITGEVTFNPKRFATITPLFSGIVREVYVYEGDKVKKGERVACVFSKDFLSAQSDYLLILRRYKRAMEKGDEEEKNLSTRMLSSAEQKLKIMGLDEEDISALSRKEEINPVFVIKSPISGTIIESNAIVGGTFEEGTPLFKIAQIENLWVNVNIHEKELFSIKSGSPAIVKISSLPDKEFKGRLTVIGDVINKETRTVKGRVEVLDRTGSLKPGMFVEVLIQNQKNEEIISIPESAVRKIEGKDFVFVLVGENSFELREVNLGRSLKGFREVVDGLKEGERIVSEGSFILKSHILKEKMEVE